MKRLHSRLRSSASQLSPDGFAPASLALDFLGTSNTLDNRITFSRGSQATLTDSTGKLTYAPNNLLTNSESFEASSWIKSFAGTGLAPVVTANAAVAPDGTTTADLVVFDRGAGNAIADRSVLSQGPTVANTTAYTNSIYIKAATAGDVGKQIAFRGVAGAGYQVFTLTASWVRINLTETSISTTGNFELASRGTVTADNQVSVHIWGAQLEAVTYQTTPSTYNSTTPKNLLGYTQEFDNAAWTKSNAFVQTNLLTYSEAFDNAAWTKTSVTVTANNATAPDGTSNADSAATSAASGAIYQSKTIAADSSVYTGSVYIKYVSGSTDVKLRLALTGGTAVAKYVSINASNGAFIAGDATYTITSVGNGWYRVTANITNNGTNTSAFLQVYTTNEVVTTNTISLWGAQLVQGSTAGDYQRTYAAAAAVQYVAPNGTTTADKIVGSATTGYHSIYQSIVFDAGTYTISTYAKAAEYSLLRVADGSSIRYYASFDLSNGTVVAGTTGGARFVSASVSSIGSGWYRCAIVVTGVSAASAPAFIGYPAGATLDAYGAQYTGDGTSGIYVWGAQLSNSASLDPYVYNPGAAPTSTAYYGPRFDYDPVTLQAKGLLIEEQRTNRTLQSGDFTAASWVATVVGTSTRVNDDAPLGFTRGLITATSATGGIRQIHSGLTSGQVYALSFYIQSTATSVQVVFENGTSQFGSPHNVTINPSNGTAGVLTGFTSVSIQPFGPGYVYTLITAAAGGALAANIEWRITNSGNSIWLGRPQFEAGAFATSYIPTVASTVTRSADVALMQGANFASWYNATEGTFTVQFDSAAVSASATALYYALAASNGTASNFSGIYTYQAAAYGATVNGGAGQANINGGAVTVNTTQKVCYGYKANSFAASLNGAAANLDGSGTIPTVDRLTIGALYSGTNLLNGHICRITYYPQRLPDYQLQRLTA